MRAFLLGPSFAAAVVLAAFVGACSATGNPTGFTSGGHGGSGGSGQRTGAGTTGMGGNVTVTVSTGGSGTTTAGVSSAYAHTNDTLFKLDASKPTLALSQIGKFDCLGGTGQDASMTDIAVN